MPFPREPHFCQPPAWPYMFRLNTVWQCRHCKATWKIEGVKQDRYPYKTRKQFVRFSA